jgi:hypothetical protein
MFASRRNFPSTPCSRTWPDRVPIRRARQVRALRRSTKLTSWRIVPGWTTTSRWTPARTSSTSPRAHWPTRATTCTRGQPAAYAQLRGDRLRRRRCGHPSLRGRPTRAACRGCNPAPARRASRPSARPASSRTPGARSTPRCSGTCPSAEGASRIAYLRFKAPPARCGLPAHFLLPGLAHAMPEAVVPAERESSASALSGLDRLYDGGHGADQLPGSFCRPGFAGDVDAGVRPVEAQVPSAAGPLIPGVTPA